MIANEREYRITKGQLARLQRAIETFDLEAVAKRVGSRKLAEAEINALRSEVEVLASQAHEFDALSSGSVTILEAASLTELPTMLVRARIARQLTQRELAERVGLKEQQIQRYEAEGYARASLRRLREVADALGLRIRESAVLAPSAGTKTRRKVASTDWNRFPVREMYRRRWFDGFTGSVEDAIREADTLVGEYVERVIQKPAVALHSRRVRSGSEMDPYALLAWECRVLTQAGKRAAGARWNRNVMNREWFAGLAKVSSAANGPIQARTFLDGVGISLVIEPALSGTYLDGAALLYGGNPVIGMTLRYDRLDNFWFVLFHELIHLARHLKRGEVQSICDDLDSPDHEPMELEADKLAGDALISDTAWGYALARYLRTKDAVLEFATEQRISPAIVAGKIRHEAKNYVILSELVGQGEVRKHFSEASFGA